MRFSVWQKVELSPHRVAITHVFATYENQDRRTVHLRLPSERKIRSSLVIFGRFGHSMKCLCSSVAVSSAPHRNPHAMRGPAGRPPRLCPAVGRFVSPRTVGLNRHVVKCRRISVAVSLAPQLHPHIILGPGALPIKLARCGSNRQSDTRTQLAHLRCLPDMQFGQNGRSRYPIESAPQQMQTPHFALFI